MLYPLWIRARKLQVGILSLHIFENVSILHRRKLQFSTDQRQMRTNSTIHKTATIWRIRSYSSMLLFWILHENSRNSFSIQEWRKDHFEDNKRLHYVILHHDIDVLNQDALLKVMKSSCLMILFLQGLTFTLLQLRKLHQIVNGVTVQNKTFLDICVKSVI